jgi:hypothetical protein
MARVEGNRGGLGGEVNLTAPMESLFSFIELSEGVEWLSKERADGLMRLRASFSAREEAIEARRNDTNGEAIDAELERLGEEQAKAEDAYLTPAERKERALREPSELIAALATVDLTRAEYERLAALNGADEEAWRTPGTPESAQALALLGQERYAEVMRGYDEAYQSFLRGCRTADLPAAKAADLLDIKRQYDTAIVGKPRADAEALRLEALRTAEQVVGKEAFTDISHWIGSQFRTPAEADSGPDSLRPTFDYTVSAGDTLPRIAEMFGVTAAQLAEANELAVGAALPAGRRIVIPLPEP